MPENESNQAAVPPFVVPSIVCHLVNQVVGTIHRTSTRSRLSMMMMSLFAKILVALAMSVAMTEAFSSAAFLGSRIRQRTCSQDKHALAMKAIDINSEAAFDKTIKEAGSKLVVVDYSTTWCGPCKVIAPKFDELSLKYPDSVFLKVS